MTAPAFIAPSILSADFARLGDEVDSVLKAGADMIHFDVMDNHYVPNLTIGPLVCEALRRHGVAAPIDVHLMVEPVDALVPMFAKAGASHISFHPEASRHVHRTIQLIKASGCEAGLVLNPATPVEALELRLRILLRIAHVHDLQLHRGVLAAPRPARAQVERAVAEVPLETAGPEAPAQS